MVLHVLPGEYSQILGCVYIRYFGHTCRPSGCELVRDVMFGVVDGKRKRGRPKISVADNNIVSWTGMSLHENCQLASLLFKYFIQYFSQDVKI